VLLIQPVNFTTKITRSECGDSKLEAFVGEVKVGEMNLIFRDQVAILIDFSFEDIRIPHKIVETLFEGCINVLVSSSKRSEIVESFWSSVVSVKRDLVKYKMVMKKPDEETTNGNLWALSMSAHSLMVFLPNSAEYTFHRACNNSL